MRRHHAPLPYRCQLIRIHRLNGTHNLTAIAEHGGLAATYRPMAHKKAALDRPPCVRIGSAHPSNTRFPIARKGEDTECDAACLMGRQRRARAAASAGARRSERDAMRALNLGLQMPS